MLSMSTIRKLTKPGLYRDEPTLYLRISKSGAKSWIQRVVIKGRRVDLGLGSWPLRSIQEARDLAFQNHKLVRDGGDPLGAKHLEAAPTFSGALDQVLALHGPTWKGRTATIWKSSLATHASRLMDRPVTGITSADVLGVLTPLWNSQHATGEKVKRRIGVVLKWAVAKGYREGNPVDAVSAVLPKSESKKGHLKTIPHGEVKDCIQRVRDSGASPSIIQCFEFMVLCAVRSGEARGATWEEIDWETKTWTIPASRMKTGKEHRVPLSTPALEVLREAQVYRCNTLLFPSTRGAGPLASTTLAKLVKALKIRGVPHSISRVTFRMWCAESNVVREVAEACLAHAVKGVEGAYQRSDLFDRRRGIMESWGRYVYGAGAATVVSLHG